MNKGEVVDFEANRHLAEKVDMVTLQLSRRPSRGGGGVHVELLKPDFADGGQIVVSRNGDVVVLPQQVYACNRIGAVSDEISQRPNLIEAFHVVGIRDHTLERFDIRVNVGNYERAQMLACGKDTVTMIHRRGNSPKAEQGV